MRNLYLAALFLCCFSASAQVNNNDRYHGRRLYTGPVDEQPVNEQARTTGQSGTGANIDVVYHRAQWRIVPDSAKAIRGIVTTYFTTTQSNVSVISFDLNSVFNNSDLVVNYHGSSISKTLASNKLTITLPSAIAASGTLDSVQISYYGVPPGVSGAAQGYQLTTSNTATRYISTLSESYEDRDWWPCKADMQDKIDSMDIIVTTRWTGADTFWVASNGILVDSAINGTLRTFKFKTRYAIPSYLVSVSVAKYNRYYRGRVSIGGVQVPVVYYLFRGKTTTRYNAILAKMDQMTTLLSELSNKFGHYPFKYEKHGFYEGLDGAGGMEHQTFSAMASSYLESSTTLAHELMHQWFGNKVTFRTWADLWLAEGFARYGEVLAGELVPATGVSASGELSDARSAARSNTTTPTRITSYANSSQVWTSGNTSAVYDRGCMVVSMLRVLAGDDKFFESCRNYLDSTHGSGYRSANSDSLKNNFERVTGGDLDPFFNSYVIGNGHPTYTIHWQPNPAKGIYVSIANQTTTPAGRPHFNGPVVLRVQGAGGKDTTIVFYDLTNGNFLSGKLAKAGNGIGTEYAGNRLHFPLSFVPTTVTFDHLAKTLGSGSTVMVSTLDLEVIDFTAANSNGNNIAHLTLDDNLTNTDIILERSANGNTFSDLGLMKYQLSSQPGKHYYFTDDIPLIGNNYYRAKFKNAEGHFIYSRIVKLFNEGVSDIVLLNNPVTTDFLELNIRGENKGPLNIAVTDASGRSIMKYVVASGTTRAKIKLPELAKGTYVLTINNGEKNPIRFFVQ